MELMVHYSGGGLDAFTIFNNIYQISLSMLYHVLGLKKNDYCEQFINSQNLFSKFYQN